MYKKKWGSSLEINRCKWFPSDQTLDLKALLNNNDISGFGFTLYSKSKYHPYFSFKNYFYNEEDINQEIFTFGGMRQVEKYILHWGLSILFDDDSIDISKDFASFLVLWWYFSEF